jgi:chromosome partitioning protein
MTRGNHRRAVFAIANVKGGTSKTTSAVYLSHALHEKGRRVCLIDADPQGSAVEWSQMAEWGFPFPVVPLPSRSLYAQIDDVVPSGTDVIVIDTPPIDQRSGIVTAAIRAATMVIAPVAPTPIEYDRLPRIAELMHDAADFHGNGEEPPLAVLLTRTVANTLAVRVWREQAEADGYWCLTSEVRFRQQFAQAYGESVTDAGATPYGAVVDEVLPTEGSR